MEFLLILGIAAAGAYWLDHRAKSSGSGGGNPGGSGSGSSGSGSGTGTAPPPPPAQPLPPGLYPAGTPGALPIDCTVYNSDGFGQLIVTPGGVQSGDGTSTFWYGPGTVVSFMARLTAPGWQAPFTAFDHFAGPGVSTRQNPFSVPVRARGFVTAVYAFAGQAPH